MNNLSDEDATYKKFNELINMSATEIKKWIETAESKTVGIDSGDGESVGRKSAKKIVKILEKKKSALTKADFAHMHKVIAYISRHAAQGGPAEDKKHSPWIYSLRNWGHDPEKDQQMKTRS